MSRYNILVVDDEPEVASIIKRYLSIYEGFKNIVIAGDGVQAMQKLQNQEFDLIVTDIILPKRDGMTIIDDIRKIPSYAKIKIMIVSGYMSRDLTVLALKKGIRQIVVKPFSALQILEKAFEALEVDEKPKKFAKEVIKSVAEDLQKRKLQTKTREEILQQLKKDNKD
jgi:CheY-like chemotaxis protein